MKGRTQPDRMRARGAIIWRRPAGINWRLAVRLAMGRAYYRTDLVVLRDSFGSADAAQHFDKSLPGRGKQCKTDDLAPRRALRRTVARGGPPPTTAHAKLSTAVGQLRRRAGCADRT